MHYLGESAANIIQGYGVSFAQGLKLRDLQQSCYIHPCEAEDFVKLAIINQDTTETPC